MYENEFSLDKAFEDFKISINNSVNTWKKKNKKKNKYLTDIYDHLKENPIYNEMYKKITDLEDKNNLLLLENLKLKNNVSKLKNKLLLKEIKYKEDNILELKKNIENSMESNAKTNYVEVCDLVSIDKDDVVEGNKDDNNIKININ